MSTPEDDQPQTDEPHTNEPEATIVRRLDQKAHDIEDVYRMLLHSHGLQLGFEIQLDVIERECATHTEGLRRVETRLQEVERRVGDAR